MQKMNYYLSTALMGLCAVSIPAGTSYALEPSQPYVEALMAQPVGRLEEALRNPETLLDLYVEVFAMESIYQSEANSPTASAVMQAKAEQAKKRTWINAALKRESQAQPIDDNTLTQLARERYEVTKSHFKSPERRRFSHILLTERTYHAQFTCAETQPGMPTTFDEYVSYVQYQLGVGADFSELARKYSADTQSAAMGGALPGWVMQDGSMVAEFEAAAFKLKRVGDVSSPVKSRFGIHIIRLDALQDGEAPPFEKVAEQVKQQITDERNRQARVSFMNAHYPNPEELESSGFARWVEGSLSKIKTEVVGP